MCTMNIFEKMDNASTFTSFNAVSYSNEGYKDINMIYVKYF